ncbi:MAG TPA: DUF3159 domain-containing protein [Kutzneria sp.]|jgi:hypothetical protein
MNLLARKAMTAIGWRTIAEAIASRVLFLVVYLLTGRVLPAALVAVGGVLVFTTVRLRTERPKWWQAAIPLAVVGLSAALAQGTGHAADFYLPDIVPDLVLAPVFLVSIIVRRPVVGLILRGQQHDLYRKCTVIFLVKFVVAAAVMLTLYLTDQVVALAIAGTVLTTPALALCAYLSWRIIR